MKWIIFITLTYASGSPYINDEHYFGKIVEGDMWHCQEAIKLYSNELKASIFADLTVKEGEYIDYTAHCIQEDNKTKVYWSGSWQKPEKE